MDTELNWMQEYAAAEVVEQGGEGRLTRREMLTRLVAICGSTAAATTFLAACSSAGTTSSAGSAPAGGSVTSSSAAAPGATTAAGTTALAPPPTNGGAGHPLSVAADDPDVKAMDVSFPGPAGTVFGYDAQPAAAGSRAGVVVNHEIFGLTDHIKDVARRVAKLGYLALAVDLVSRDGGTANSKNIAGALTQGSVDDRVADLNAGVAYLEGQPGYDGKLGVVGFCFGGGMTLSFAAANPKVLAAVSYYGPTPQPASVMTATNAAILGNYGATDARVDAGIPDLEAALQGKTFEKHLYEGAGHAFNNDTGGAYNEAAALEAWSATNAWFARYLR